LGIFSAVARFILSASSHQDIALISTPDTCHTERIHTIIIPTLDLIDNNPGFKFEIEQTHNPMEVLDAVPSEKQRIIVAFKKGQFCWGATFNQPYARIGIGGATGTSNFPGPLMDQREPSGDGRPGRLQCRCIGPLNPISPEPSKSRTKIPVCQSYEGRFLQLVQSKRF
jgi:hypothetical protein